MGRSSKTSSSKAKGPAKQTALTSFFKVEKKPIPTAASRAIAANGSNGIRRPATGGGPLTDLSNEQKRRKSLHKAVTVINDTTSAVKPSGSSLAESSNARKRKSDESKSQIASPANRKPANRKPVDAKPGHSPEWMSPVFWMGVVLLCDVPGVRNSYEEMADDDALPIFQTRHNKPQPLVLEGADWPDMPKAQFVRQASEDANEDASKSELTVDGVSNQVQGLLSVVRNMRANPNSEARRPKLLPPPRNRASLCEMPFIR